MVYEWRYSRVWAANHNTRLPLHASRRRPVSAPVLPESQFMRPNVRSGYSLRNPKMLGDGPFVGYKGRRLLTILTFPCSPTSNPQRSAHVLHKIFKQPNHSQDEVSCSSKPTHPNFPPLCNLTSRQSLIAAATLSGTSAAAASGYIQTYQNPDCVSVSGVTEPDPIDLPMNTCVQATTFMSFRGGLTSACPTGETAAVMAYTGNQCDGTSVSAGTLPASQAPGDCTEIAVEVGDAGVAVGGRSAMFMCL